MNLSWLPNPAGGVTPGTEDLLNTVVTTKLFGEYHKRMGVEFFHAGYPVVQAGFIAPRNAARRLGFEIQIRRGNDWQTLATDSFRVKRGVAGAVFGGRKGKYRANNSFLGSDTFAASTSNWQYFTVTR